MDIRNTKIYFGEDKVLAQEIFNRLKELGADSHNNWRTFDDCVGSFNCYRIDDEHYMWTCNTKEQFDSVKYKEITTKDLGMEKKQNLKHFLIYKTLANGRKILLQQIYGCWY